MPNFMENSRRHFTKFTEISWALGLQAFLTPTTVQPWLRLRRALYVFGPNFLGFQHTYIHNKSYSAQSYMKQSDCALQMSKYRLHSYVKAMLKRCVFRARRKEGCESISLILTGRLLLQRELTPQCKQKWPHDRICMQVLSTKFCLEEPTDLQLLYFIIIP